MITAKAVTSFRDIFQSVNRIQFLKTFDASGDLPDGPEAPELPPVRRQLGYSYARHQKILS